MPLLPVSQDALDDATFAGILEHHRARVLQFLLRLCAHEAEDLLQETLAKVWRLRRSFCSNGNAEAWLLQAAFRTFCDHRARLARRPTRNGDVDGIAAPRPACHLELRDEVEARLQTLSPLERELLIAFHRDGQTLKDLAARHALPLNTVKSHLHRARARLAANGDRDDAR